MPGAPGEGQNDERLRSADPSSDQLDCEKQQQRGQVERHSSYAQRRNYPTQRQHDGINDSIEENLDPPYGVHR